MMKLLRAEQNLLGSFFELMYNILKGDKAMDKIVLSEYNECKRYILDELIIKLKEENISEINNIKKAYFINENIVIITK